jgi:hypothetical protein
MQNPHTPKLHLASRVAQDLPVHESTVGEGRASTAHVPQFNDLLSDPATRCSLTQGKTANQRTRWREALAAATLNSVGSNW